MSNNAQVATVCEEVGWGGRNAGGTVLPTSTITTKPRSNSNLSPPCHKFQSEGTLGFDITVAIGKQIPLESIQVNSYVLK